MEVCDARPETTSRPVSRKRNQDLRRPISISVEDGRQRTSARGREKSSGQSFVLQRQNERGEEARLRPQDIGLERGSLEVPPSPRGAAGKACWRISINARWFRQISFGRRARPRKPD